MQFLAPSFLWALSALAIPIAIHLFQFRRYKRVYFSNVQLLQEAVSQQKRQRKLKHLLILAARMLAIVALVLAFARPHIQGDQLMEGSKNHQVILIVDNSLSMTRKGEAEASLLQEARQKALEIIDILKPSDEVFVLTGHIESYYPQAMSPQEAREFIRVLPSSAHAWNLASLFEQAEYLVAGQAEAASIFLISDFQAHPTQALPPPSKIKTYPIKLQQNQKVKNASIDSLWLEKPFVQPSKINELSVLVQNRSSDTLNDVLLELSIDDKKQYNKKIDLLPGESKIEKANILINQRAFSKAQVQISEGLNDFDNTLNFALNTLTKPEVAIIHGVNTDVSILREVLGDTSLFSLYTMQAGRINKADINSAQALILADPNVIDANLMQTLSEALQKGKSLMILPGKNTPIAAINTLLSPYSLAYGKLLTDTLDLIKIDYQSTLYKNAFLYEEQYPLLPSIGWRYALAKGKAKSLLSFSGAWDFLQHKSTAQGAHIFLAGSHFAKEYNNMGTNSIVVPTLRNFALSAASVGNLYQTLDQIDVLSLAHTSQRKDQAVSMRHEQGSEFIPYQKTFVNRIELYPEAPFLKEGFYTLSTKDQLLGLISYTRPSAESHNEYYNTAQLAEHFQWSESELARWKNNTQAEWQRSLEGHALWPYFIIACLLFLLLETALHLYWKP